MIANEYGNCHEYQCTGMRGFIQNGGADCTLAVQVLDQLEPIIDNRLSISSVNSDSWFTLASIVPEIESRNLDLIETLNIIDFDVIVVYIVIGLILFKMATLTVWSSTWLTMRHMIKQEHQLNVDSQRLKMASLWFTIAIFWLHCMYGNLVSTDLVAATSPDLIDSLEQVLISNRKPILGLQAEQAFSSSMSPKWRKVLDRVSQYVRKFEEIGQTVDD